MRIAIALSASAVMLSAVVAQRPGPPAFLSMASAAAKDVIIFHGGQLNTQQTTYTSEMWALDVTVSWKSSSPAWTNLTAPGAPRVAEHSAVMSKDFSQLMVTNPSGDSSPFLYLYSLKSKTWSTAPAPAAEAAKWATRRDVYFVTDKDTGNAWMIGGVQGTQPTNSVDKFDPTTGQWTANMIPSSANKQLAPYSTGTAHYYNGKIYIFGGYDSTTGVRGYQSFQRLPYVDVSGDTPVVGDQYTLGPIPPPRQDHCSVLTGSDKVYIFGGYDANSKQTLEDMWVLDLPTWTWKQLIPGPGTRPRRQHACHIIGANIVIFGGAGANLTGYPSDVQVYDVVASAWAAEYVPKQDTTPRSQPPQGGPGSSGGLSVGAIIGIVVGALVVVFIIFSIIFFKRRQRQIEIREAELEKEAYLASLRPEPSASGGGQASHHSPAESRMAFTNMDMGSPAYYTDAAGSPLPATTPGVQYLMQPLPDGTIAVQPVYLDATAFSPAGVAAPTSAETETGSYISPAAVLGTGGQGSASTSPKGAYTSPASTAANTSAYPLPYPSPAHHGHGTETAQDPFASPVLGNSQARQPSSAVPSPLPPPPPAVGSPQHIHPDANYGQHR